MKQRSAKCGAFERSTQDVAPTDERALLQTFHQSRHRRPGRGQSTPPIRTLVAQPEVYRIRRYDYQRQFHLSNGSSTPVRARVL